MIATIADTIRGRRTIHEFRPGAPPQVVILDAIAHASWAPNHYLTQPWRFYLLGPETVEAICLLNAERVRAGKGERAAEMKLRRWRAIPGWLLLTCQREADEVRCWEDYAACCCAAQNMMLFLWDRGIGVKWTTGEVIRDPRFFEITRIDPARERVVGIFWYGIPAEIPATLRKPPAEFISRLP
ncbi:MAG: nitroreductase [Gammaproteobacteria bacterium]|nr:nitroreductase [Gammaproteobacteria bacterium]